MNKQAKRSRAATGRSLALTLKTFAAGLGMSLGLGAATAAAADMREPSEPQPPPSWQISPWGLSFGAAFTSDYNFRGISQSARRPAVQADAEITYNIYPNLQLYAAIFGSSLKLPSQASMELDGSFGIRPSFGDLNLDFGATYYGYPGELPGVKSEFWEFYGKASYKVFDMLTVGANLYHAPNWLNLGARGTYYSLTAALELPANFEISGELGRYSLGRPTGAIASLPDYTYWNAGLSYKYKVATLDLRYHDTNLGKLNCNVLVGDPRAINGGSKWCGAAFIATLKFDYSVSNLFAPSAAPLAARY